MNWQREPPDEAGDWLWVEMKDGEVLRSGIYRMTEKWVTWTSEDGARATCSPNFLPMYLDSRVTVWAKIDLPSQGFLEGENHG